MTLQPPRHALAYYVGMFLLLLFLVISIMRHMEDIRIEEAAIFTVLTATVLFAICAAWRAVTNGR